MPQARSKYEFFQGASLSQQLAHRFPEYKEYAGTDPEISQAIATLNVLNEFGIIDLEEPAFKLIKAMLNERRKASFATSEKVNEITKMGLQLPKRNEEYAGIEDEE